VREGRPGAHTSSSSTKLIHGGLRYLEYYEFGLVRKALAERELLLRSAPHIMWPLRFVMPHDPSMRPVWMIRASACSCTTTWPSANGCRPAARWTCAATPPARR
jgi:glycerol-3-phosphate dehydrogenase